MRYIPIYIPQKYLKIIVLIMAYINYRSKVFRISCKLIKLMKDNIYILDRFYYNNFNLLFITFYLHNIIFANLIYNKKFCSLINLNQTCVI